MTAAEEQLVAELAEAPVCVHCGVEVREINFALGKELRHSEYPHVPRNAYRYCKRTVAETARADAVEGGGR